MIEMVEVYAFIIFLNSFVPVLRYGWFKENRGSYL